MTDLTYDPDTLTLEIELPGQQSRDVSVEETGTALAYLNSTIFRDESKLDPSQRPDRRPALEWVRYVLRTVNPGLNIPLSQADPAGAVSDLIAKADGDALAALFGGSIMPPDAPVDEATYRYVFSVYVGHLYRQCLARWDQTRRETAYPTEHLIPWTRTLTKIRDLHTNIRFNNPTHISTDFLRRFIDGIDNLRALSSVELFMFSADHGELVKSISSPAGPDRLVQQLFLCAAVFAIPDKREMDAVWRVINGAGPTHGPVLRGGLKFHAQLFLQKSLLMDGPRRQCEKVERL